MNATVGLYAIQIWTKWFRIFQDILMDLETRIYKGGSDGIQI